MILELPMVEFEDEYEIRGVLEIMVHLSEVAVGMFAN